MNGSDPSLGSSAGGTGSGGHRRSMTMTMTDHEEKERRASIKAIMADPGLTPHERRRSIQSLMDGRRRSSHAPDQRGSLGMGGGMAAAAAAAAADFEDSSSDADEDEDEDERLDEVRVGRKAGGGGLDNGKHGGSNGKREAKKRSSFVLKRGSSQQNVAGEKPGKRRASLRDSFTAGFSRMGVKGSFAERGGPLAEKEPSPSNSICLPARAREPNAMSRRMEKSRPPCGHYERNCSIVSPCCGLVFGCRICHDDAPELPPPFLRAGGAKPAAGATNGTVGTGATTSIPPVAEAASSKPPAFSFSHRSASLPPIFSEDESHHEIDRFSIKEVICRECFTRQDSKTNNCVNCGVQFGTYHCSTCNLWMSADEEPYHCLKCGFCRVGGRENFTHCDDCGMCIDALLFDDHNCKSGKYMSNCPVCQEDLFSSRMASHEMPCGHAIHWHCFRELTSHDTRCPVCKKTAETPDQMEPTWNAMAMGIALQPVPADMARVVDILCNDCEEKGANHRWHFLGVQCRHCTSFNTTVERTVLVGQEAADFLGPPSDAAAQARWAAGGADPLTALMEERPAGPPGGDRDELDGETFNRRVSAEVMDIMNSRSNEQPFPRMDDDGNAGEAMDIIDGRSSQPFPRRDEGDEMDQS